MVLKNTIEQLELIITELKDELMEELTREKRDRIEKRIDVFTESLYFNRAYSKVLLK